MRKIRYLIFIFPLFFQACNFLEDTEKQTQFQKEETSETEIRPFNTFDTISKHECLLPKDSTIGDLRISFHYIPDSIFEHQNMDMLDSLPHNSFLNSIKKVNHCYLIPLNNGGYDTICDIIPIPMNDTYIKHQFSQYFETKHLISIAYQAYEGLGYFLKDTETRHEYHAWGPSYISPDSSFLITTSVDLESGYHHNGLQLFDLRTKPVKIVYESHLIPHAHEVPWGPSPALWLDNNTVAFKCTRRTKASTKAEYAAIQLSY